MSDEELWDGVEGWAGKETLVKILANGVAPGNSSCLERDEQRWSSRMKEK